MSSPNTWYKKVFIHIYTSILGCKVKYANNVKSETKTFLKLLLQILYPLCICNVESNYMAHARHHTKGKWLLSVENILSNPDQIQGLL